jgi:FAD/FMN-containing dehydrogenase
MNQKQGNPINKKKIAASIVVVSAIAATGYEVNRLSANPVGEKDCPPAFAENAPATGMPIAVEITPLSTGDMLRWQQKGGTINDASCLDRTSVYGIIQVTNIDDIRNALAFAKENKLKVSMAGARHSMGGQAFFRNALVLDMTKFNQMSLDEANKVLTVQSGATWHDIQNFLHPKFAVKAMQSRDIFTLGGSISVNAHGMDHQAGSVGSTIRSMRVLLPDGTIVRASRTEHAELFHLVVGGYGLFGVILDVELEVTENVVYEVNHRYIDYAEFPEIFDKELMPDPELGLFYGHLSTAKNSLLKDMILYIYTKANVPDAVISPLQEESNVRLIRFMLNLSKRGDIPMGLKWFIEKQVGPVVQSCTVTRTQAMKDGEVCLVTRNDLTHESGSYLRNNLRNETDILHEYFIPRTQFIPFMDGLRRVIQENDVILLNVSVRVVHPEQNFLNYAPIEMYSIVLYINQPTNTEGNEKMGRITRELIDLTNSLNGRFYLPYQLHYTPEQLERAYPEISAFFEAKKQHDPDELFTNTFYEKYSNRIENR